MASSQGTTVTINNSQITCTSISVEGGSEQRTVSGAHLGLGKDDFEPTFKTFKSVSEQKRITAEYIGAALFRTGITISISASGGFSYSASGTVVSSRLSASVGELIRGSVTVRFP